MGELKPIRSKIEYFNKFFKNSVGYEQVLSYTYKFLLKTTFLSVFLEGLVVSKLKHDNKLLQHPVEIQKFNKL
ncbi:hypothetical protein [Methanobrevibacter curvatus]|uniref:Uncharacterized protein n=1 Tax=Methanobrevibacter curvatus TaxID=49547 RepID=A0A166B440_9EURY|nr:hypothetical protein [Methanobrevibacter curvatus]KZX12833.1 hypothetical protein MBCUR_08890 [Methanobrevibacter curvatus]